MSTKYALVYNTTNDSIPIDEDGRVIAPREWGVAQRSKVQEEIGHEHLIAYTPSQIEAIDHTSNPLAIAAKEEYERLTAEWEAEKAEPKDAAKEDQPTDYDEASKPTTKTRTTSKPNKSAN